MAAIPKHTLVFEESEHDPIHSFNVKWNDEYIGSVTLIVPDDDDDPSWPEPFWNAGTVDDWYKDGFPTRADAAEELFRLHWHRTNTER